MYSSRDIFRVSLPIALGLLAQTIIQVTDSIFLGRVGEIEFGAAGLAGIYYIAFYMLGFGFSVGGQIMISRRNGERHFEEIGSIVVQGILFLLLFAGTLFILSTYFSGNLLPSLIKSPDILNAAEQYLGWRNFGLFFSFVNVMFRAFYVGIARTPVLTLNAIVMAVINVIADYVLIFGKFGFPALGIEGAALASVMAEAASVVFFIIYTLVTVDLEKYGFKRIRFNFSIVRRILNISVFTMVQYLISLSTWFIFFLAIENLGERNLAITNIIRTIYMLFFIPINALSTTANTLVGNTMGARKIKDVLPLVKKISMMSLTVTIIMGAVAAIFPEFWISLIASGNNVSLVKETVAPLLVVIAILPVCSVGSVLFNSISGTGNTAKALVLETITLAFYMFGVWLIVIHLQSSVAICWTVELIYWGIMLILSFFYLTKGNWQAKRI